MGQNRLKNKNKSSERQAYDAAVKRWKDAEPKLGFLSNQSARANLKQSKKYKDWLAKKPPSFAEFQAMNKPATESITPKSTKKIGEGTVLKRGLSKAETKRTVKQFDKIMRNAKGGKSGFLRKLLPSKDRLSPSQRMAKAGKSKGAILRKRLGK